MNTRPDDDTLRRAAQLASQRPFFIASALAVYASMHQIADDELATLLGCPQTALPRLALCRLPDATAPIFRAEVERIASYTGVNSVRLAQLLREVASTAALRRVQRYPDAVAGQGALMAARDRSEEKQPGDKQRP